MPLDPLRLKVRTVATVEKWNDKENDDAPYAVVEFSSWSYIDGEPITDPEDIAILEGQVNGANHDR